MTKCKDYSTNQLGSHLVGFLKPIYFSFWVWDKINQNTNVFFPLEHMFQEQRTEFLTLHIFFANKQLWPLSRSWSQMEALSQRPSDNLSTQPRSHQDNCDKSVFFPSSIKFDVKSFRKQDRQLSIRELKVRKEALNLSSRGANKHIYRCGAVAFRVT